MYKHSKKKYLSVYTTARDQIIDSHETIKSSHDFDDHRSYTEYCNMWNWCPKSDQNSMRDLVWAKRSNLPLLNQKSKFSYRSFKARDYSLTAKDDYLEPKLIKNPKEIRKGNFEVYEKNEIRIKGLIQAIKNRCLIEEVLKYQTESKRKDDHLSSETSHCQMTLISITENLNVFKNYTEKLYISTSKRKYENDIHTASNGLSVQSGVVNSGNKMTERLRDFENHIMVEEIPSTQIINHLYHAFVAFLTSSKIQTADIKRFESKKNTLSVIAELDDDCRTSKLVRNKIYGIIYDCKLDRTKSKYHLGKENYKKDKNISDKSKLVHLQVLAPSSKITTPLAKTFTASQELTKISKVMIYRKISIMWD